MPSLSVGTRPDVHGTAFAAHAHWLLGHDDEARSSCREAIELARAIDHPYSLAVALAYGAVTHQLRHDAVRAEGHRRRAGRAVRPVRLRLLPRVGAGPGRLVPRRTSRASGSPGRASSNLKSDGSFARMPYWLSLLAELYARNDRPAVAAAHARRRPRRRAGPPRPVVDARGDADARRRTTARRPPSRDCGAAAEMARAHGSVALLRRCEHDLAERGVRPSTPGVPRTRDPNAHHERCANAALLVSCRPRSDDRARHPKGTT